MYFMHKYIYTYTTSKTLMDVLSAPEFRKKVEESGTMIRIIVPL